MHLSARTDPGPTIVILDDHPALRIGLRLQVEANCGARVLGEAHASEAALQQLRRLRPAIVIAGVRSPSRLSLCILRMVEAEALPTRLVVLSEDRAAATVQEALAAGAWGYVAKDSEIGVVLDAVRAVAEGRRYVDPSLLAAMVDPDEECGLSARERQVLQLAADGMRNRGIAQELGVGEETVKSHLANVMRKLGASSRTEAVAAGLRRSIIA